MILRYLERLERWVFSLALRDGYPHTDRLLFAIAGWLGRVGDWIRGGPVEFVTLDASDIDPRFAEEYAALRDDLYALNRINARGSVATEARGWN